MKTIVCAATAAIIMLLSSTYQADAMTCRNGTVQRSTAFGIDVCVDPHFADKFVAFFSSLKASGCHVREIVCQAYGHRPGSNHVGGGACDVDQRAKNRTSSCMYHAGDMIKEAGLFDGCSFRDCGHVEAMRGLGHYGATRVYAARRSHHHYAAVRRHHRVRLAYATPTWAPPQQQFREIVH